MTIKISYDLSAYIDLLQADNDSKALVKCKKGMLFCIDFELYQELSVLKLTDAVRKSCALINLNNNFRELVKNSIDAKISNYFSGKLDKLPLLLQLEIDIKSTELNVVVSYKDYSGGFKNIASGNSKNYLTSSYRALYCSDKLNDKTQLGGALKGLHLLNNKLSYGDGNLVIGNHKEHGALIILSSSLAPYYLPVDRGGIISQNFTGVVPTLTLPASAFFNVREDDAPPVKRTFIETLPVTLKSVSVNLFFNQNSVAKQVVISKLGEIINELSSKADVPEEVHKSVLPNFV